MAALPLNRHLMAMTPVTSLEQTALAAIIAEAVEHRVSLEEQLRRVVVVSRENTGGGFFTEMRVSCGAENFAMDAARLGLNVWISVEGLEYGLGMILHLKNGYANLLEGYAVGPEDTSGIDFTHVRFALAEEPGPLLLDGS
jgi:hypothetical protein